MNFIRQSYSKKRMTVSLIMPMTNSATCNIIEDLKMYFATVSCTKRNKVSCQIIFSYLDIADKSLLIYSPILYLMVYLLLNIVTWHLWASDVPWDYNKSSNVFVLTEWSILLQKPDSCGRLSSSDLNIALYRKELCPIWFWLGIF